MKANTTNSAYHPVDLVHHFMSSYTYVRARFMQRLAAMPCWRV
jgi:hypothetical protein